MVVDVCLGGESGPELVNVLTRGRPDLAVLLMSATDLPCAEAVVSASGARGFVEKSRLLTADLGAFLS